MNRKSDRGHAGLREKICFGTGSISYCTEMVIVLTYLMLYCSDVLKINVAVIGIVMTAVKILDAVSDIVITSIADRTRGKWGKYRIWMFAGIPLGILLFLLFLNPGFLATDTAKVIWICVIYVLLVPVMETAVSCPYMAMIVTMSEHAKDRLDFSMARALGEAGAQIIASVLAMPIVLFFGGYRDVTGWRVMGAVIGGIIIVSSLICFFGTKERVYVPNENAEGRQLKFPEKMRTLHGNRPFWKLIAIIVLFMAHYYASSAMFTYFCIYNLGHEEWVSVLLTAGFVVQIIITVLLFYLGRKIEKRTLLIVGAACIIVADVLLFLANGFAMAVGYQILLGLGNGMFNAIAFSMLPDVTDYTQWKTGIALPGMISAIATFAMKMGGAASAFLASQILIWANYDENAAVQSVFTQNTIRVSMPVLSIVCLAAAMILIFSLRELGSDKIKLYREEIDRREDEKAASGNLEFAET